MRLLRFATFAMGLLVALAYGSLYGSGILSFKSSTGSLPASTTKTTPNAAQVRVLNGGQALGGGYGNGRLVKAPENNQ